MRDAVLRVEQQRRSESAIQRILGRRSSAPERSESTLESISALADAGGLLARAA